MKNEYKITKRLMKSWAKGWYFNGAINIFTLFVECFCVALYIFFPYMMIHLMGHKAVLEPLYTVIFVICHAGALLLLSLIYVTPRSVYTTQYRIYSKDYCVKKWQRIVEFTDDEIIVNDDDNSVLKFEYSTIKRVKEKRKMVIVFLKSGFEIRLYKKAFVEGSWEECKRLISRKAGVNVK